MKHLKEPMHKFDISYITVDSLSEGVGASQIEPLILKLGQEGLRVHLTTYEKTQPTEEIKAKIAASGVVWNFIEFSNYGPMGALKRLNEIRFVIPDASIIHARSDIPAAAANFSDLAPVLWDVRSFWADQRLFMEKSVLKRNILKSAKLLERYACLNSEGMSSLTNKVVPELESRYRKLPRYKTVVPTTVDLQKFKFSNNFPKKVRALYSGTLNDYYDLKLSAKFTELLNKSLPLEIHWARPKESKRLSLGVGETSIFEAPQFALATILSEYSFGIAVCKLDAGVSLKAAMPTKIAEFLAVGRPVVINKGLGDFDELIEEFKAGVILDGTSANLKECSTQLQSLLHDKETPERCRALAEKYFDFDKGFQKYLDIYSLMVRE